MSQVEVQQFVPGSRDKVFATYADYLQWPQWTGSFKVELQRPGQPTNGIGCVRVIRGAGLTMVEEIDGFDPPSSLSYRLLTGLPLRDYTSRVLFTAVNGGTHITWRSTFLPKVPGTGWALEALVRSMFSRTLKGLATKFAHGH